MYFGQNKKYKSNQYNDRIFQLKDTCFIYQLQAHCDNHREDRVLDHAEAAPDERYVLVFRIEQRDHDDEQHGCHYIAEVGHDSAGYAGDLIAGISSELNRYGAGEDLHKLEN